MGKRILNIEDEESIQILVKIALEMNPNFEVIVASTGKEGVALAAQEIPDAILLDMTLTKMDGFEVLKQLQSSPLTKSIPVVLLTTKFQDSKLEKFQDLGIRGIIPKPFDPLTIENDLTQILDW